MRRERGVTLIELLVAMTLFALLSGGVFWSLRSGLSSLGRVRERVATSRRELGAQRALEQMIAGMMATETRFFQPGSPEPYADTFFQGEPEAMRFVTLHSLQEGARGRPMIVELRPAPSERGGLRLIVNERPYYGPFATGVLIAGRFPDPVLGQSVLRFQPIGVGPGSYVIADQLTAVRFWYLEPRGFDPGVWVPRWINGQLPDAVRVDMGGGRAWTARVYAAPRNF